MSIKNTPNTGAPAEPSRRRNHFSRAILVSLCLGVLLAGIVFLSYNLLKAKQADNAASQAVSEPAIPSGAVATRPPAPASQKPVLESQLQAQQKGKASDAARASSARQLADRIIARAKMLERAPRRQTVARAETEGVRITPNSEAPPQDPPVAPTPSADPNAAKTQVSASSTVSAVNDSKEASGIESKKSDLPTATTAQPSNADNKANESADQLRKTGTRNALQDAISNKAKADAQTKGPEFRAGIGTNTATTTKTTEPGFVAAAQEPASGLKVEISSCPR